MKLPNFGLGNGDIALGHGDGIRNDSVILASDFSESDTFYSLPSTNFPS
ncbi:MAG: hypothetical protein AAF243_15665 [Cyanobacteria bacterium P01_A01_bin.137]